jgi:hypothetical protein
MVGQSLSIGILCAFVAYYVGLVISSVIV